jgi:UDP-N-acetyl-D-mannosaminuronic acid transferase (WecB/TagA/CpsF family)
MNLDIGHLKVTNLSPQEIKPELQSVFTQDDQQLITYANAHTWLINKKLPWLNKLNLESNLVLVDGYGIVWATSLLHKIKPALVTLTYQNKMIAETCVEYQKITVPFGRSRRCRPHSS